MSARIGIPSTLHYYSMFPMWDTFFKELGVEVVATGQTTKKLLDDGVREALADACVPVKIFFGHAMSLKNNVDYLFIPRVVCLNKKTIFCPKFLGLPDMIRHGLKDMPPIIDTFIDARRKNTSIFNAYFKMGSIFGASKLKVFGAYIKASNTMKKYQSILQAGWQPPEALKLLQQGAKVLARPRNIKNSLTFAILGYPYIVNDDYISVGLIRTLNKMGVTVLTTENLPYQRVIKQKEQLGKRMFWTYSDLVIKATHYLYSRGNVDGIIHLTAFGCGPDSLLDKYMELTAKEFGHIPFMNLTVDEHSGDAGVATRLEAFTDMVFRKKEAFK